MRPIEEIREAFQHVRTAARVPEEFAEPLSAAIDELEALRAELETVRRTCSGDDVKAGNGRTIPTLEEAFWARVEKLDPDACWRWRGYINTQHGYGEMQYGRRGAVRRWRAHRLSFLLANGNLPDDKLVMHSCDNPWCVNPRHLSLGTVVDNNRDCIQKGRHAKGVRVGGAKLREADVLEIRRQYAAGVRSAELAARYRVNQKHISEICAKRMWKHVP